MAEAGSEAKSAFLSSMSHEIRTPINAVLGMNEMILRESEEQNTIEYAENIRTAGNSLLGLVNDILDFSKIEAGKMDIIPVGYELSSVLNDLVNMIQFRAEKKGLEFVIHTDSEIPNFLYGDEIRLKQVVTNILTNAVKYTEKGSVTLTVDYKKKVEADLVQTEAGEADAGHVDQKILLEIHVKDTGIGIKEEDQQKLFSAFERIEEERNRNIEGTRLGMNITTSLLSMMGSELKEMVRDAELSDMITVGEMSSTSLDNCIRYSGESERELSMVFHFQHLKVDYKDGDKWSLMPPDLKELGSLFRSWQEGMQEHHAWDALFWDNHDQPRAVSRFGNEKEYWDKSAKMLAGLIHLMRGTPYIYQGDEIGMTNAHFHDISRYKDVESRNYFEILKGRGLSDEEAIHIIDERSRDNGRTPMQWNDGLHAGFTSGEPWIDVTEGFDRINAESQFQDEDSIFNFYRNLITLRKEHKIISDGSIRFDENCPEGVISYFREYEGDKLLVWGNMTDQTMITASNGMIEKDEILLQNYTDMPLLKNDMVILRPFEFLAVILANGKGCR